VPACAWRAHAASWTDVVAMWASGRADSGDVCAGREPRASHPACEGGRSGGAAPDSLRGGCVPGVCAAPADSGAAGGRPCCSQTSVPDADQAPRRPSGAPTGAGTAGGTVRVPDAGAPEPRTSGPAAAPASAAGGTRACSAQAGTACAGRWPAAQARTLQRAALAALTSLAACAPAVRAPAQQPKVTRIAVRQDQEPARSRCCMQAAFQPEWPVAGQEPQARLLAGQPPTSYCLIGKPCGQQRTGRHRLERMPAIQSVATAAVTASGLQTGLPTHQTYTTASVMQVYVACGGPAAAVAAADGGAATPALAHMLAASATPAAAAALRDAGAVAAAVRALARGGAHLAT